MRIISDETTPAGRIVTVRKSGVEKRVSLPPGVLVTPEDLEALAFDSSQSPDPVPKQQISVNSHLYFYGLVVDEKTNALSGARIEADVEVYQSGNLRWEKLQLYSEVDGRFTINVPWGQTLALKVGKQPDYLDPPPQRFKYGLVRDWEKHTPNVAAPVVFVLHRRQPLEPLFLFRQNYRTPNTAEPTRLDLTTGKLVSDGGDLIVSIYHPDAFNAGVHTPWKLSVQVVNGGLVEVPSRPTESVPLEYMHQAPVDDYRPGFALEYGPDSAPYRRQYDGWFYVKSRGGQLHAKIYFYMNTRWDERGVPFRIEAVVNTNASRNLQTSIGR